MKAEIEYILAAMMAVCMLSNVVKAVSISFEEWFRKIKENLAAAVCFFGSSLRRIRNFCVNWLNKRKAVLSQFSLRLRQD